MILFGQTCSAKKTYHHGTHRTRSPVGTLADYSRFMPMMGITRLADITGLDRIGLPVYIAVRPNSRSLSTSQGKGESRDTAKASALMESIETWHCERITSNLAYESFYDIGRRAAVVDIRKLALRSDAVLELDRPMLWVEGWDLVSSRPMWVPLDTVSIDSVLAAHETHAFLRTSNGLASGNHLLEALVHATCELIERDAVALWSLHPENYVKARRVCLDAIEDPTLRRLLEGLRHADVVAGAWDITSDIGIPSFTVTILEDPDTPRSRNVPAFSGHGTHLSPEIALTRALTEAIQSRLTIISGSRDDMFPREYADAANRDDQVAIMSELRADVAASNFDPTRPPISDFFEDDVSTLLTSLVGAGIESVVAVDLTRPDVGIPVVKVVIPGLETIRSPVYRPGRRARSMAEGHAQ